ncbi:protein phosphatase 1-binding protein bifocal isoform X2 [Arctopsyche grandis]|uniref:protein phosphatase 1-binding protein bifocal isoform X2 n=1 Tax=Arctopsyche grandis TaxID=121162 RepID=UPI00406D717C
MVTQMEQKLTTSEISLLCSGVMEESVPQWMRELRERRRATGQSGGRRATPDMLLQPPAEHQNQNNDHQEDLTYGPGIVKKLKSRYISLTLRDSPPKPRPSLHPLRRAASLEHGLDDEPPTPTRKFTPKTPAERPARYRPTTRTPEYAKRARSVDTLVRCDSRSDDEHLLSPLTPPPPPTPPPQPAPSPERTLRPKRPSPLLKETERPPPDLVKTTLKIFEANPVRRTKSPAYTGQVADKVKSYTVQQCNKPKIAGKKPTIPPRSPLTSPDGMRIPVSTQTTPSLLARPPPSPKKLLLSERDSRDRSPSPVYGNKHPIVLTSPVKPELNKNAFNFTSPDLSPTNSHHKPHLLSEKQLFFDTNKNGDLLSPSECLDKSFDLRTSTPDPEIPSAPSATEISLISPRTPVNPTGFDGQSSETSSEDGSYDVVQLNGNDDPPTTKVISQSTMDNIAKAGTTTQYSFGGVNGLATNGEVKKSYLPTAKAWPTSPNRNNQSSSDDEIFAELPPYVSAKNPCLKDQDSLETKASMLTPLTPLLIPNYTMPSEIVPLKRVEITKTALSPPRIKHAVEVDPESSPALILHEASYNNSPLTSREIEKNLINKSKSLEQPVKKVVVSVIDSESKVPKTNSTSPESPKKSPVADDKSTENSVKVSVNVKSTVVPSPIPEAASASGVMTNGITTSSPSNAVGVVKTSPKKPHWQQQQQQQQNTMVFNFSNRKEVPDYIENDGIILRSSTRDRPKASESISLSGLDGESCTDGQDDDADGDWAIWAAGPPSPCNVNFENDNIVINGRSNIHKPNSRSKQLKIQFDDSLTQTFEYPSEASLIEDYTTPTVSPLAIGGSLSTYTPSKVLLQAETYQLGVTRSGNGPTTNGQKVESEELSSSAATNGDVGNGTNSTCKQSSEAREDDYLKPLRDGDSHNWSHETHRGAGDLLF